MSPGRPAQAVVSESLWRRRYGSRADLIGRTITVSDNSVEVVGIAPADFYFERRADVWLLGDGGVPRFTSIRNLAQNRDVHILTVVGRLKEGVSVPEAQAELDVISARLAQEYPATSKGWGVAIDPLQSALVGHTRRMLTLLLAAVALMLVIASVNVANLVVVRTKGRALELAMRSALGASPARVLRQILAESAVLAACGGLLGIVLSVAGTRLLVQLAPEGLPRIDEVAVDGRIAAFAVVITADCRHCLRVVAGVARVSCDAHRCHSGQRPDHGHARAAQVSIGARVERAGDRAGAAGRGSAARRELRPAHVTRAWFRSARSRCGRRHTARFEIRRHGGTDPIPRRGARTCVRGARRAKRRDGDAGADAAGHHSRRVV